MISMAKSTLGLPGQIIAWIAYLFLLYTLLAGYISGGSDVFSGLLHKTQIHLPDWIVSVLFTTFIGLVVYKGIRSVDYVNRGLMFGKLGIYVLLVAIISPHVTPTALTGGSARSFTGTLMILIASFGFASIIPSLRDYFEDDVRSLRRVILLGSIVPLFCYIVWNAVIMGVIAREGDNGLIALMSSQHVTSELTEALNQSVQNKWISGFFGFFTSICMLTAFLGVSLGLFDFLADGLKLEKSGDQGKYTLILTFIPPLIIVLFNPGIYLRALNYAGICCVILLLLLPTVMAWKARKTCTLTSTQHRLVPGGNACLGIIGFVAIGLLIIAIMN